MQEIRYVKIRKIFALLLSQQRRSETVGGYSSEQDLGSRDKAKTTTKMVADNKRQTERQMRCNSTDLDRSDKCKSE